MRNTQRRRCFKAAASKLCKEILWHTNDDEPEDRMIATALKTAGVIEAIGKVDQE